MGQEFGNGLASLLAEGLLWACSQDVGFSYRLLEAWLGLKGCFYAHSCDSWQEPSVLHWPVPGGLRSPSCGQFQRTAHEVAHSFPRASDPGERETGWKPQFLLWSHFRSDIHHYTPLLLSCPVGHRHQPWWEDTTQTWGYQDVESIGSCLPGTTLLRGKETPNIASEVQPMSSIYTKCESSSLISHKGGLLTNS